MNASETYYKQEESKKFKDWTQGGLEFLLKSRADVLTMPQIALIKKQLTKIYLEEKREMSADCATIPMATL
jgi:hypothetical protein